MIWRMAMVNTLISMEVNIKVNLKMISKRAMERKSGSMVLSTSEPTRME